MLSVVNVGKKCYLSLKISTNTKEFKSTTFSILLKKKLLFCFLRNCNAQIEKKTLLITPEAILIKICWSKLLYACEN